MADVNGKSAPFSPAIGLGSATFCVIGLPTTAAASQAQITAEKWGQAALGPFIGVQDNTSGPYSQAQGDTPADFDAAFAVLGVDNANTIKGGSYTRASANQYSFPITGITAVATTATAQVTVDNQPMATGDTLKVTVYDQVGRPMSGVSVAFAITGGTATGGSFTPVSPIVTDANGVSQTVVKATGAGTVTGTATPAGLAAKTFSCTLT